MMRTVCLIAALFSLAQASLAAELTRFDPAASSVSFSYTQMGVAMKGRFADLSSP